MAISTHRALRNTEEHMVPRHQTQDTVGPGTYSNTHNEPKPLPGEHPVPFNSLQEKKLNTNNATSAITPGPGTYAWMKGMTQEEHVGIGFTSLKSKVRRLGPTSPGSSIFMPSTIEKNPGPGAYKDVAHPDLIAIPKKEPQVPVRPVLEVVDKTTPSIPLMKLLPGQSPRTEDADVASMVMRHTGERGDTVGPGEYDPRADNLAFKTAAATKFHGSTASRHLWEPTNKIENKTAAPLDNPGPGSYDHSQKEVYKEGPDGVNTYQFASKTPMCHQRDKKAEKAHPGPGQYELQGEIERGAKSAREKGMSQAESAGFGSMCERGSTLVRPSHQPFKDPYNVRCVPGPGHYADARSSFPVDPKKKEVEKALPDHIRRKLYGVHHPTIVMALQENNGPLHAFFSTDQRPCNKKEDARTPAPGEYLLESARGTSMDAELRERAKLGRKGAFGTCADRFFGSPLEGKQGLPDPGMIGEDQKSSASGAAEPWSTFQSQTPRFQSSPGKEVFAKQVGKHNETPAPGEYMIEKEPNYRSPFRHARNDHLSFGSGKERFHNDNLFKSGGYASDPRDYAPQMLSKHIYGGKMPKAKREPKTVGCTTEAVGPGSYGESMETGMLKKTFNVSTQAPVTDDPYGSRRKG